MKTVSSFWKDYKGHFIVIGIILIAILFRFYNFPNNPPSLNWDEVAIGYNAHSILETGKDEFGISYPLQFRSFDDYKMPVYVYMTAGTQLLFGYNDFAVRFPAAFFGVLAVFITYFLVKELTGKKAVASLSALFLAVLPWHVQFTRYALEASVAFCFVLAGILFFIYGVRKKPFYFVISSLLFSLSLYTYLSFRVLTVPIVVVLVLYFWKKIQKKNVYVMIAVILFTFAVSTVAYQTLSQKGNVRLSGISVLNQAEPFEREYEQIWYEGSLNINIPRRLFHQPQIYVNARLIARGYLTHFEPDFLFFDLGRHHHTSNIGLLYFWMIPLILAGFYYLFRSYDRIAQVLIVGLLALAPLAASVTVDIPHAIRSILLIFPFITVSAIGFWELYQFAHKRNKLIAYGFIVVSIGIFILSSWNYFRQYQIHLPHEKSQDWMYGRAEMTEYLEVNKSKYDKIVVSHNIEWPYIFMLYYSKYDPKDYLDQGGTHTGSWEDQENKYDKYEFRRWDESDINEKTLVVGLPNDFPESIEKIYSIQYLDGTDAIYFVEGNKLQ